LRAFDRGQEPVLIYLKTTVIYCLRFFLAFSLSHVT
jgi:hypothetical protein